MRHPKLRLVLAVLALGASASACAQHGPSRDNRHPAAVQHAPPYSSAVLVHGPASRGHSAHATSSPLRHGSPVVLRGAGPNRNLYVGQRLPKSYRARHHVVQDWRHRHLAPPPRGHQWVKAGSDYLLVALASGIIASIVLTR